jgi:hypothetical protein
MFYGNHKAIFESLDAAIYVPLVDNEIKDFGRWHYSINFFYEITSSLPISFVEVIVSELNSNFMENHKMLEKLKLFMAKDIFIQLIKEEKMDPSVAADMVPDVR